MADFVIECDMLCLFVLFWGNFFVHMGLWGVSGSGCGRAFFIFVASLAFGGAMCGIVSFVEWSCWRDTIDGTMGAPPRASALFSCPCLVVALCCWGGLGSLIL